MMSWRQWMGLCQAKGHKRETLEAKLKGRSGFSSASLSKLSRSTGEADPQSIAFAWELETLQGAEDDFELYWRGLASLGVEVPPELLARLGTTPPPRVDHKKIAEGLAPTLDAIVSTIDAKLDSILSAMGGRLDSVAASVRGKLDTFTMMAVARLDSADARLDAVHGKLDVLQAAFNHADAIHEVAELNREKDKRELLRAVRMTGGAVGGLAVLTSIVTVVVVQGQHVAPASSSAAPAFTVNFGTGVADGAGRSQPIEPIRAPPVPQPVFILASTGQGGAPLVFDLSTLLGAVTGQMGEKLPPEQYIPRAAFPGQKPGQLCDARLGEEPINGGCWFASKNVKPPCGVLFRQGDTCYRPVAADPQKPVMVTPQAPGQESR